MGDPSLRWFSRSGEIGPVFLRVLMGARLVWGTQDNVFSHARMHEFAQFLAAHGVGWPLLAAYVSAWAQFLCGILWVLGLWTRWASLVMIVNFVAAVWIAHRGDTFEGMYPALTMLATGLFLLVHGPGRLALDGARGGGRGARRR